MRRGSAGLAALGTALALAIPAAAQRQGSGGGEIAAEGTAPAGRPEATRFAGPHADPNLTLRDTAVPESDLSTRLVGTLPLMEGVDLDLGVGLFSVLGETEKKSARRRTDPRLGVDSADTRVAAVGFSMRF